MIFFPLFRKRYLRWRRFLRFLCEAIRQNYQISIIEKPKQPKRVVSNIDSNFLNSNFLKYWTGTIAKWLLLASRMLAAPVKKKSRWSLSGSFSLRRPDVCFRYWHCSKLGKLQSKIFALRLKSLLLLLCHTYEVSCRARNERLSPRHILRDASPRSDKDHRNLVPPRRSLVETASVINLSTIE